MTNRTSLKQLNHALIVALALFPAASAFAASGIPIKTAIAQLGIDLTAI